MIIRKLKHTVAALENLCDHRCQKRLTVFALAEYNGSTGLQASAGVHERLPMVERTLAQKDHLDVRVPLAHLRAVKPRGNHLRVIYDHNVAGVQHINYIMEDMVPDPARFPVDRHQARHVPHLARVLRYQLLGQVVPEILRLKIRLYSLVCYHCTELCSLFFESF